MQNTLRSPITDQIELTMEGFKLGQQSVRFTGWFFLFLAVIASLASLEQAYRNDLVTWLLALTAVFLGSVGLGMLRDWQWARISCIRLLGPFFAFDWDQLYYLFGFLPRADGHGWVMMRRCDAARVRKSIARELAQSDH